MSDALHESLDRVLSMLIAILPGILAFFAALLVFTLLGWALSALLRTRFKPPNSMTASPAAAAVPTGLPHLAHRRCWRAPRSGDSFCSGSLSASPPSTLRTPNRRADHLAAALPNSRRRRSLSAYCRNLIARFLARSVLIGVVNAQLQYARFFSLG